MAMKKILKEHYIAAELISSDVFDKKISAENGAQLLFEKYGLNISSAKDFIYDYKHLLAGEVFKRSMSSKAIDYFLNKILEKRGEQAYKNSIIAFEKHINYLEKGRTNSRKLFRKVLEIHRKNNPRLHALYSEESFELEVQKALDLSPEEREKLLNKYPKIPKRKEVITTRIERNPAVVANVLIRANGKCESCGNHAPFVKLKSGQPYLEVHHKVRLADDGEDTVENAIAVCPNCHRYLHYGV